jgi:hypothetical protein
MSPARLLAFGMLSFAGLLPVSHAGASVPEEELEPQLILPGSHAVLPGQVIVLEWTAAEDVQELEILLSLDGGRTYPRWISPQLHPGDRRFVWRVPLDLGPSVRMRIRFNRGGREIEGAPSAPLAIADLRAPQPLGLPLAPADSARPGSGTERDVSRSDRADATGRQPAPDAPPARRAPLAIPVRPPGLPRQAESSPAFVPLRA